MGALLSEPITAMVVEQTATTSWSASSVEMQGWRRTHEDVHIFECSAGGPEASAVFAVLDGHGGQAAAHLSRVILQELLVDLARRGTLNRSTAASALSNVFAECDRRLREQLPLEDRSGTTAVAAVITQTRRREYCVQLAHCGDSRAVVSVGNELVCSEDHKPGRQDEEARIRAAGGSVEYGPLGGGPLRVDGALAVSRSFGDFHYKEPSLSPEHCKVSPMPDVQTVQCSPGDWLLLACDGVFDVVSNEEAKEFVGQRTGKAPTGPLDGRALLVDLLRHCLDKGSKDNITALFVQLLPDGVAKPYTRELLPGDFKSAGLEAQTKYKEFFESHGFSRDAATMPPTFKDEPPAGMQAVSSIASRQGSGEALKGAAASAPAPPAPAPAPSSGPSSWFGLGRRGAKALAARARLLRQT